MNGFNVSNWFDFDSITYIEIKRQGNKNLQHVWIWSQISLHLNSACGHGWQKMAHLMIKLIGTILTTWTFGWT